MAGVLKQWDGTAWVPVVVNRGVDGMPAGGAANEVLSKNSPTDYDASWKPAAGGISFQDVLTGLSGEASVDVAGAPIGGDNDTLRVGYLSVVSGDESVAVGPGATVNGDFGTASGYNAVSQGDWATSFGSSSNALAKEATATGPGAEASAEGASAHGAWADARKKHSGAYGYASVADHENSVAVGANTLTTDEDQVHIGDRYLQSDDGRAVVSTNIPVILALEEGDPVPNGFPAGGLIIRYEED